jgi:hypothetical protein
MTPSWQLVQPSLNLTRKNFESIIVIVLLPVLLTLLGSLLITKGSHNLGNFIEVIGVIWLVINAPVSYYLQLAAARGGQPGIRECYASGLPYFWRVIGFEIWFSVLMLIGLVLLIVPGLIVLRRYYLTPFYIIDRKLDIGAAMTAAHQETNLVAGFVWGTIGVVVAFAIVASILSVAGPVGVVAADFVALIYLFGPVLRYREIAKANHHKPHSA